MALRRKNPPPPPMKNCLIRMALSLGHSLESGWTTGAPAELGPDGSEWRSGGNVILRLWVLTDGISGNSALAAPSS